MQRLFRCNPDLTDVIRFPRDGMDYERGAVYPESHLREHFNNDELARKFTDIGVLPSDAAMVRFPPQLPQEVKDQLLELDFGDFATCEKVLRRIQGFTRKPS